MRVAELARTTRSRRGFDGRGAFDVQTAFFGGFVFPPPASGAEIFAHGNRAGARFAADAGEKLVVQRVVIDFIQRDVMPHIAPRPIGERVEFGAFCVAGVDARHFGTRTGLFAAQTRNPRIFSVQRAGERFHFAHIATSFAQVDAFVHRFFAVAFHELNHRFVIRRKNFKRSF